MYTAIWNDKDWRFLRPGQQHMYMLLLSQYKVSHCGVLDWIPSRLVGHARGLSLQHIETEVESLCGRDYLVLDTDSSELLIRSFIRWDGLLKMGRPSAAIAKDYRSVTSNKIKACVMVELQRLHDEDPKLSGWAAIDKQDTALMDEIRNPTRPIRAVS